MGFRTFGNFIDIQRLNKKSKNFMEEKNYEILAKIFLLMFCASVIVLKENGIKIEQINAYLKEGGELKI